MTTVPVSIQERLPMPPGMVRRPAGPAAGSLTFGDIIRILKQRIFLIVFIWFFVTAATAGLTYYWLKYDESYKAEALIEVSAEGPHKPYELGSDRNVQVEMLNRWLTNQAQRVKQMDVLNAAFADPAVVATNWYRSSKKGKDDLFEDLKSDLSVSPVPNTSFLLVSFPAPTRKDAERIVDTVVDKYLAIVREKSRSELTEQLDKHKTHLANVERELESIRVEKERFIADMINTPGITSNLNVPGEHWRALATEATRLEAEQLQLHAAYKNLSDLDPSQVALSPQLQVNIQQDPQVMGLNNNLMALRQEYNSTLGRVGPNHRQVQALAGQITAAEQQLDQVIRQKEDEIRQFQLVSAETGWLNALQAQMSLAERVTEFENKQRDLDSKLARVRTLEDKQEMLKTQYERMSDFVQQLALLVSSQEIVSVKKINPAFAPPQRYWPRVELTMPVGSFLGLLMGVGLALLLEIASTSIRTPRDIVRHVHIPMLGTVPDLDDEEVNIERLELASHAAPRSMIAEAFRTIRTNLLLSSPAERQRTVLVTSSKAEEGKTTVAVNLAISVSQSGRRVLLVDANFHRPSLHTLFPKSRRDGLSNILIGRGRLEDLATATELPNLDVLTCGPIPPNPTELLSSRYMAEMITQASGRYDQIIFDAPPVLLVSDALVLASQVDGVILVCRAKSASRGVIARARERLERVNARIFGAVLNAARIARGGYFREQMRSYYDYQPEEALLTGSTRALPSGEEDKPGNSTPA